MPRKDPKRCLTPRCRNKKAAQKNHCHACLKRQYRSRNKMRDCWQHLKDNSKRRGIFFDLTFDQFKEFCVETEYLHKVGKSKLSYSVDRIIEEKGYTVGNLQVLTLHDNSIKEHARRKARKVLIYDWATNWATVQKSIVTPINQSVI